MDIVENPDLDKQETNLAIALQEEGVKNESDVSKVVEDTLKPEEKTKTEIKEELKDENLLPEISNEELKDKEEINLDSYMTQNIENGNFKVEEINDNVNIIYTNEDTFFVEIIEAENPEVLKDDSTATAFSNVPVIGHISKLAKASSASAATKYTGKVSKKYVAYSWVGLPLWEIYTKGEFKYTGSSVTPYFYDGYVKKRFTGAIWQIDNYGEGTTTAANKSSATIFTRANFHYGLEYDGVGIVVQYLDVRNQISCTKSGKISKTTNIRK
ncbi:hypothetical protein P4561_16585 [Priestia flexa]|uniref:hypothetical protein n=1 Tax=Priestia flexa TaxID=86664 RepID=UPI002E1DC7CF|nr:hypothetical protein [Priestia flexa]